MAVTVTAPSHAAEHTVHVPWSSGVSVGSNRVTVATLDGQGGGRILEADQRNQPPCLGLGVAPDIVRGKQRTVAPANRFHVTNAARCSCRRRTDCVHSNVDLVTSQRALGWQVLLVDLCR